MDIIEVKKDLCYYDKENPEFCEDNKSKTAEQRKKCYCDNCFNGKDKLAREIIRLTIENEEHEDTIVEFTTTTKNV